MHITNLEMNQSLSVSSIESSSKGEEGGSDWQISPELLNKAFSTKSTQYMH
jgi:hypothetical protein